MKITILLLVIFSEILTAQLLTVNNLQHLAASPLHNLDTKLAEHFDLKRNPEMEDENNRVYSNHNLPSNDFKVLTIFTDAKDCNALSLVTHNPTEIHNFQRDLMKEGFTISEHRDKKETIRKRFTKENVIVIIKNQVSDTPAHQIIWMCR